MAVEQQLQELVERARSGDHEPYQELLDALRQQGRTTPDSLRELARSEEPVLRRAALHLASDDADDELLSLLASLANDAVSQVRQALAQALEDHIWWPFDHVVSVLMADSDSDVRLNAVRAARWRSALELRLVERLTKDDYWRVRQEIARVLAHFTPRAIAPVLLSVLAEDGDTDVQTECASSLEKHLQALGGYPDDLLRPSFALMKESQARVTRLRAGLCPQLSAWLQVRVDSDVDIEELKKYGALMTL